MGDVPHTTAAQPSACVIKRKENQEVGVFAGHMCLYGTALSISDR